MGMLYSYIAQYVFSIIVLNELNEVEWAFMRRVAYAVVVVVVLTQ